MDFKIVIPVIISFVISVILAPVIIPFLRRLKASQTERTDGVKSHLSKAGTPTMGGLIFLIAVTVTSLLYIKDYPKIIPILFLTLGFGLIGFLDDYLKVVLKRSDGLLPAQKMAGQIVVTAIFAFYLIRFTDVKLTLLVPFSHGYYWNIGWVAVPLLFVAVIGTVNGVNFTDGLDGLAASAVPSIAIRQTAESARPFIPDGQIIVDVAKGIEPDTLMTGYREFELNKALALPTGYSLRFYMLMSAVGAAAFSLASMMIAEIDAVSPAKA